MKNSKIKQKGFTYIELVVTMLIFIALSLISYPIYTGVAGREQSKLAEGYALLGYIVNAQVAYYNEYGTFLNHYAHVGSGWNYESSIDTILGINAINNRYFTKFTAYGINSDGRDAFGQYKYHFTAKVFSKNAGTIMLEYNLTKRFEPVVSGV